MGVYVRHTNERIPKKARTFVVCVKYYTFWQVYKGLGITTYAKKIQSIIQDPIGGSTVYALVNLSTEVDVFGLTLYQKPL